MVGGRTIFFSLSKISFSPLKEGMAEISAPMALKI